MENRSRDKNGRWLCPSSREVNPKNKGERDEKSYVYSNYRESSEVYSSLGSINGNEY